MTASITRIGPITEILLDRPEKRNALDETMLTDLRDAAAALDADPGCRAVIVHGAGPSFCAGLDTGYLAAMSTGDLRGDDQEIREAMASRSPGGANLAQQLGWAWRELPMPVIAVVHGHALGGGLNLALGADFRIVAPDAALGFVEVTWGLIPDMSGTQSLRRLVGPDRAKELIMTGRTVDGTEAVRLGLATEVAIDPLARARELAQTIAAHSPAAVRAAKAVLDRSAELDSAAGLELEAESSRALMGTREQIEAVTARLEGRPADYGDGV